MNKTDLVRIIAEQCRISKTDACNGLDCMLDVIADALKRGEDVHVPGFGTFVIGKRRARTGRNPQTGMPLMIPAANTPIFRPSQALRDEL